MDKLESFFREIENFKKEQNKQKKRGLNNYNILTSVLNKSDEVRLHSRMIYSLLNPEGSHYQGNLFLEKFINILNIDFEIDLNNCLVYKEYHNIDLYITDGNKHIILENKVHAKDQKNQIKRYITTIQKENSNLNYSDILVVYLSLNRIEPSKDSLDNLFISGDYLFSQKSKVALFKSIHYKNEILEWLESSQHEVQNITNLNEVFNQYINVVKMINNIYKDKVMNLSEHIKKDENSYLIAMEIHKEIPKIRETLVKDFFNKVIINLSSILTEEWVIKIQGDLSKRYSFPFRIYKKKWLNKDKYNLIFGFEFNKHNYYDGYFGVVKHNKSVDIKNDIFQKFKYDLEKLEIELNVSSWWLHWFWLPNYNESVDFVKLIMFEESFEKKFVDSIVNVITIFELNDELLTKINQHLNKQHNL